MKALFRTSWVMLFLAQIGTVLAQPILPPIRTPDKSPKNISGYELGLTDIVITYHSPAVNGRKIWGNMVPYGRVWRAGANENTTITFEHPVTINGERLEAGTYGLHIFPSEKEWTIIFSTNSTSWGSFSYDQKEDALRINAIPQEAPMTERLTYTFNHQSDSTVQVSLAWEKLKASFTIEVEVLDITMAMFRNEFLRSVHKFDWLGGWFAANYCYAINKNLDQALEWINQSIAAGPNFINLKLKSDILTKLNKPDDAKKALDFALKIGTVYDIDNYIFFLSRNERGEEALKLAKENAKKYPDIWQVNGGLARAYSSLGNTKEALKYARLAHAGAELSALKSYWERMIRNLETGKSI